MRVAVISYLKKKNKELDLLINHLDTQAELKKPAPQNGVHKNDVGEKPKSAINYSRRESKSVSLSDSNSFILLGNKKSGSTSSSSSSDEVKLEASISATM